MPELSYVLKQRKTPTARGLPYPKAPIDCKSKSSAHNLQLKDDSSGAQKTKKVFKPNKASRHAHTYQKGAKNGIQTVNTSQQREAKR